MKTTIIHGEVWVCIHANICQYTLQKYPEWPSALFSFSRHTHYTHSVILTCTNSLVGFGQSVAQERVHCRKLLQCWNTAKVQGRNTSHEYRAPPPTELRLEVGPPVRLKLKMEERQGNGPEIGLPKGLRPNLYLTIVLGKWSGNRLGMVPAALRSAETVHGVRNYLL